MQTYPSISKIRSTHPVYVFDKIDGSNIRAEWTRKAGFKKFGSRTRLLEATEQPLGEAITLFQENYADILSERFSKARFHKATVFIEFFGENSFAGHHLQEPHELAFLDVHVYKQGLLYPKEFLNLMGDDLPTPILLASDIKISQEFIQQVQTSNLPGMGLEGVVCKGGTDKHGNLSMFKIKSFAWLQQLRTHCQGNERLFDQLA